MGLLMSKGKTSPAVSRLVTPLFWGKGRCSTETYNTREGGGDVAPRWLKVWPAGQARQVGLYTTTLATDKRSKAREDAMLAREGARKITPRCMALL
ncbi:hypothetical protein E2C01_098872 [Portunus trituberculatus]|uniref:Uncharacterized protein n=1 Tax=Portunus trituberculatus TaxID=210409 RepID=A0A5B7K9I3_PORTR|nr:hypothetical protein [Portunus trituberculatus]